MGSWHGTLIDASRKHKYIEPEMHSRTGNRRIDPVNQLINTYHRTGVQHYFLSLKKHKFAYYEPQQSFQLSHNQNHCLNGKAELNKHKIRIKSQLKL